jgi:AICAR transformylase/IMP cyclohydrolase PurH
LPTSGKIFVSVANRDKRGMIFPIKRLADLGFEIVATAGTGEVLRRARDPVRDRVEALRAPRRPRRRLADPSAARCRW